MSSALIQEIQASPFSGPPRDEDSDYYSESESEYNLSAQEHWEESIKQITGLVHFVIFPLLGKFLGRRCAHLIWRRVATWLFR